MQLDVQILESVPIRAGDIDRLGPQKKFLCARRASLKNPCIARERTRKVRRGGAGPSIAMPIAVIKQSLDENPKELPPYVFFEISVKVYEQETKQKYPFHSRH